MQYVEKMLKKGHEIKENHSIEKISEDVNDYEEEVKDKTQSEEEVKENLNNAIEEVSEKFGEISKLIEEEVEEKEVDSKEEVHHEHNEEVIKNAEDKDDAPAALEQ
jgi:flagellar hook-basal body complex protein FliE